MKCGIFLLTVFLVLIIAGCAEATPTPEPPAIPTPAPTPVPEPTPTPSPAEFRVISLNIESDEVMAGETVSINAEIKNTGLSEGTYTAILTLDRVEIDTKEALIPAGAMETVAFSLVKNTAGICRIELGELSGVITVKDTQGFPSGYIVEEKSCYEDEQIEVYDITYLSDGLKVKGYMAQPKAPGVYPAVIWNRGGNCEFNLLTPDWLKIYAKNGYVAIGSQYRGNAGGEGTEEFGGADVDDVLNLIPALKSQLNVDTERIGMVGYSRGGRMTYQALKEQTLRGTSDIKAACTVAGTTDMFLQAEERPKQLEDVMIPLIGGSPSQLPEEYEARSAVYWADKINVPLLIQHGEADESVSVEQSRILAQELDKYDKVYELIIYPGDDHHLSANEGGRPEIFKWLSKYLK